MRVLSGLGVVSLVLGMIWLGQGVGVIGGSFMTGTAMWTVTGAGCIVLGALLAWAGFRWRQAAPVDDDG